MSRSSSVLCNLQGMDVVVLLVFTCVSKGFLKVGSFGGPRGLGGSHHLFHVTLSLLWSLGLCPALGAAECWPTAVYPLSPAGLRHPGRAGTDPDTCHQCPAGRYSGDLGL